MNTDFICNYLSDYNILKINIILAVLSNLSLARANTAKFDMTGNLIQENI